MSDLFAPPPDSSYAHAEARAARILRDRHGALVDAIDRAAQGGAPYGAARIAVQIYNGGNMPTSTGHFFLGHPVIFTGTETEGGTDSGVVDTSTSVCVLVLGTTAPSVGDILTAYAVGGRWVAERGTGSGGGGGYSFYPCYLCEIPETTLTFECTGQLSISPTELYYGGHGTWSSAGCVPFSETVGETTTDGTTVIEAQCYVTEEGTGPGVQFTNNGDCVNGFSIWGLGFQAPVAVVSYSCTPFEFVWSGFGSTATLSGPDSSRAPRTISPCGDCGGAAAPLKPVDDAAQASAVARIADTILKPPEDAPPAKIQVRMGG